MASCTNVLGAGECSAEFLDPSKLIEERHSVTHRFIENNGKVATRSPANTYGSPEGNTGLITTDS